jgi:hypothetical protein
MNRAHYIAAPAYFVASLLILFPLLDTVLSIWPLQMGEVSWRFGAVGLFSRAVMTPLLGLLLAFAVAVLLEHRLMTRAIAVVGGLTALAIAGVSILFVLDALQMRAQVRPEAKTAFDVASAVALGKYGLGFLLLGVFAVSGWKASGKMPKRAESKKKVKVAAPVVGEAVGA